MKKIFIILMSLAFIIFLTSCSDISKKVDNEILVTYIIDDISEVSKVKSNIIISIDDIPNAGNKEYTGLYLDKDYFNEYQGTIINDDVTIYVKTKKVIESNVNVEIKNLILETYLDKYIKTEFEEATIDDISILHYYGDYNNAYVVMMASPYFSYYNWVWGEEIADVNIKYNNSNSILVWYKGDLYTLKDAYNNHFLTRGDLLDIAECQRIYYPFLY